MNDKIIGQENNKLDIWCQPEVGILGKKIGMLKLRES